jgi:hypothetical protein
VTEAGRSLLRRGDRLRGCVPMAVAMQTAALTTTLRLQEARVCFPRRRLGKLVADSAYRFNNLLLETQGLW